MAQRPGSRTPSRLLGEDAARKDYAYGHPCLGGWCGGGMQGDRILITSIDVDQRFEGDRITGSWVVDQGSPLLLLLEI